MKRTLSVILAAVMILCTALFASCGDKTTAVDMSAITNLEGLAGLKIGAQAGTFHSDAADQIKNVVKTDLPEFADLLLAVKSGTINGYVAEEPTALAECLKDSTLDYIHLVNNSTGFTATDADVGIAVAMQKGSALKDQINSVLAEITSEQRSALMEQMVKLCAGQTVETLAITSEAPAQTSGTLKIAMECAYQPFNWTDLGTPSIGAVEIYDQNGTVRQDSYANGYDVQIAKYVANKLGLKLEIYAIEWDSLIPAVQAGTVDGIIAGMSPTAERAKEVDFSDTYYSSNLVIIYKKN